MPEKTKNANLSEVLKSAVAARSVSLSGYREDLPGIYFRSRWEANYARYLKWRLERGEIESWAHEPTTFWFMKIKRGVRSYKPDFRVIEGGKVYYDEVKGWMDPKSKTKLKRMRIHHPEVTVRLVDESAYKALEKEFGPLIPNWEFPLKKPKKVKQKKVAADSA